MQYHSKSITDLPELADQLISFADDLNIWLFDGDMGAGKTTLIKAVCEALNVLDQVNSPTFALVNEYLTGQDDLVYHFDFYRIDSEKEAFDIGVEEYFQSGYICLIEWPAKIPTLLPDQYLKIAIVLNEDGSRTITATKND
ncbi:MAG TPA: tRNA (adenosine(37)-N6)-threonylcarbamoyltransferase complex ATPase subunit type 1 TsaE [Cytophagales bacterium]|nr:tRNA (adenosine(37)-N6)-threonylcarbamoyltransferase complex ATPase subunit type 1 TsaE [Cytophagales bacterium]